MALLTHADEIETALQLFKTELLFRHPFYGDILLRLPIVHDERVSTACTDGRTIYWSERFMGRLTPQQQRYVLMHEVLHVLLRHPLRAENKQPELWNIAADITVNQICDTLARQMRDDPVLAMERTPDGIYCPVLHDQTTENVYSRLCDDNPGGARKNVVLVRARYELVPIGGETPMAMPAPEPDLLSADPGGLPMTPEEARAVAQGLDRLIKSAMAHEPGAGSGVLPREILELTDAPRMNWKALLKDFLSETQSDDTSYATPERKYLHMGLILPGHCLSERGELESVWAFVDSSGSVGDAALRRFLTELYRITREFRCVMNIAYWDTDVIDVYENLRGEKAVLTAQPGHSGGTDINCVYRYVLERRLKPLVTLILTDGYFGTPDPRLKKALKPQYTLLVLCNDSRNPVYQTVGRVCRLNPHQGARP